MELPTNTGGASWLRNSKSNLTMPRSRKVTTVYNGRREVWTDYEEAKAYFLELMMTTEGEERDRAECVYIQLIHGLDECSDENE